jgi:hypothetical protein
MYAIQTFLGFPGLTDTFPDFLDFDCISDMFSDSYDRQLDYRLCSLRRRQNDAGQ